MPLAPWNIPPNFLGAIQAGAGAGLAARRADLEEQSSGDRLQLAYNQLAEEERQRNEAAKARMQMATAANALRASQIDMLSRYHQGQLQNQQGQLQNQQAGEAQRAQIAQQTLAQKLALAQRPPRPMNVGGVLYDVRDPNSPKPLTQPNAQGPQKLSDVDKAMLGADVTELKGLENQIGKTEEHGFGLLHPLGGNKSQMDALRQRASDIRKRIQTRYGGSAKNGDFESAPMNVKDRVAGKTYLTPTGPHTWTGTGWKVASQPAAASSDNTTDEELDNAE